MKTKSILVAATISVLLALSACHPATIGIEEQQENIAVTNSNPLEIDWQGNMAVNKEILLENLPMVDFTKGDEFYYGYLDYALQALEKVGVGTITEIEVEYAPADPGFYGEGERVDVRFSDDCGSTFQIQFDLYGYSPSITKIDMEGIITSEMIHIPIVDPEPQGD